MQEEHDQLVVAPAMPARRAAPTISALGWLKLGLQRTPFAGVGVTLSLIELLVATLFLAVHAVYIYNSSTRDLKHAAKSLGELLQWDLALSLLFVARNSIWQLVFSCSFERAITYHRWISNTAVLVGGAHGVMFYVLWLRESRAKWADEALYEFENVTGELALLCYLLLVVLSLPFVRRRLFELFRWAHIIFVPLFFAFILLHHHGLDFLMKAAVPLAFYGIDLLYRLWLVLLSPKSRAAIVTAEKVCCDVVKLTIRVEGGMRYKAGQYVFLILPSVSPFQAHPFSISSAPGDFTADANDDEDPSSSTQQALHTKEEDQFTVHIKASGDFTYRLLREVEMRPLALSRARVEGPYGALSLDPQAYRHVVLLAGGIGITPMLALMRHLHRQQQGVGLEALHFFDQRRVSLYWAVPHWALYHAFASELKRLANRDGFEVHVFVTRSHDVEDEEQQQPSKVLGSSATANSNVHEGKGRPDVRRIIAEQVEAAFPERVAVLVCGPDAMLAEATRECSRFSTCDLHLETFEL